MLISSKKSRTLQIKGKVNSGNVTEIHQEIEYFLLRYKNLNINLIDIIEIDIAGVYMLYLVKRMSIEKKLKLNFSGITNMAFQNALRISGMKENF